MKQAWETKRLGQIAKISYGYTEKASFENVGPKFLRITDIKEDGVDWDTVPFCKINPNELKKYKLTEGDIVFARTGATTGKSYKIANPPNAVFASYLIRINIIDNKILPDYLHLFFQTKKYWDYINTGISGSAQGGFNASKLSEIEILFPTIEVQKRITLILEEAFFAIAQVKSNLDQNLKNVRDLFESYLRSLFENEAEEWEQKQLNEISENLDSKRVPITQNLRKKGNVPYYGASGIVDYVADFLFDEDLLCISEDGANLLARTYPIAFSISGKTWVNNHAHILRFKNSTTQRFVEFYLNSIKLDDFVTGMAQPKLNQAMLNKIPIPFPSLKIQQVIIEKIETLSLETQKLESLYQQKIKNLEELKKSVLLKAFNGELSLN